MQSLGGQPLAQLLGAVASQAPAPGGGSSAACVCALGAALVEMAATIELGRSASELPADLPPRLRELRERALELADDELRSYQPVLEAARLPKDEPSRSDRLSAALVAASAAPLAIAEAAAEVAELGARVAAAAAPSVRGDAAAGVILAEGAAAAARRLVEINLADPPGAAAGAGATAERLERGRRAASAAAGARARCEDGRVPG